MKVKSKETLKEKIIRLKSEKSEITKQLQDAYNECSHSFAWGYTLEPVVYCTICDMEANDIFPSMSYEHIEKLIK